MTLNKSLLLATAAGFASVAGAQAADLPSRKSEPANYVKICDAYGAGFYTIPGTDTCLRVGGYVRAEWQYTPGRNVVTLAGAGAALTSAVAQVAGAMDTTGTEVRGRVDLDARTPTAMGTVRTAVRLRAVNTSGIRNVAPVANNATIANATASATAIVIEQAFVQWAGFTFGVAPENYAFMPPLPYMGQVWTGFPNGIKQLAYTATFGNGFSATLAIEDRTDFPYTVNATTSTTYNHTPANGYHIVGNLRVDQSWGWAVLHAMVGNNSIRSDFATAGPALPLLTPLGTGLGNTPLVGSTGKVGWAIGATAKINLPMLAAGDALYLTANYADGMLGAIAGGNNLNSISTAATHRLLGGIQRQDANLVITSGSCTVALPCTVGSVKGWNVGGILVHYWAPQWRSNLAAGYLQINPPSVAATAGQPIQWGKGSVWSVSGSLIYSPVRDFDIGLELQYASIRNNIQNVNPASPFALAGQPGLRDNVWGAKFRVERQF